MTAHTAAEQPLWAPSPERIAQARLTRFVQTLRQQNAEIPADYEGLHAWSIRQPEIFWQAIWDQLGVIGERGTAPALQQADQMPGALWFADARLNFAENLLARGEAESPALIEQREDGRRRSLSWRELAEQSARLAGTLQAAGVGSGDRVAGFLPNSMEAVIGMLATTRLGAVWSSCSPDFGLQGVIDRFGQIAPKVLLAVNGYPYAGKVIDTRQRVADIRARLPDLQRLICIDNLPGLDWPSTDDACLQSWDSALQAPAVEGFTRVSFNDPLYILYSSGTTGVPKCIVHGVGGTLLQHLKELALHSDLRAGDRLFYYTTCGWMMWNWLVSGLALGATLVLYDGSPFHPGPERLWDLAQNEQIRVFGASAKFYAACDKAHLRPGTSHDLSILETLLSTGSPLAHETFDYLYREVKADLCLASISGGTDIISCFALGNPCLPVYRGELQCAGLGMDLAFADEQGQPLTSGKGELICRTPFPAMPIGFWNDPAQRNYRAAYFERFPGVWAHGDYGELCLHSANTHLPAQQGVIIHGRADATLNPGGVRIGTAEIYRQVEQIEEILEAIAVGQQWQDDVRVILFVRLREGIELDETLQARIRQTIRANTTPRHVPAKIIAVPDIPRTISGKIVELAVRNVIHGEPVKNRDALANPQALAYFRDLAALR